MPRKRPVRIVDLHAEPMKVAPLIQNDIGLGCGTWVCMNRSEFQVSD